MLSNFGFRIIDIAVKANMAINRPRSQKFDVILSDYNLGDGKDHQRLRALSFEAYSKYRNVFYGHS